MNICIIDFTNNKLQPKQVCILCLLATYVLTTELEQGSYRYKKDKPNLYPTHALSFSLRKKSENMQLFWSSLRPFSTVRSHWSQTYEAYFVTLLVRNDDSFLIKTSVYTRTVIAYFTIFVMCLCCYYHSFSGLHKQVFLQFSCKQSSTTFQT